MRALGLLSLALALALCERAASASPTWRETAKLTAAEPTRDARFGYAVAVDGNTLVVGAPGLENDLTAKGAAYIYARENEAAPWVLKRKLDNPSGHGGAFGSSIALRGDLLIIGAPAPIQFGFGRINVSGEVGVYERVHGDWQLAGDFYDLRTYFPTVLAGGALGTSVAIGSGAFAVGAPESNGNVVLFDKTSGSWAPTRVFEDPTRAQAIGISVAVSKGLVVSGSTTGSLWSFAAPAYDPTISANQSGCRTGSYGHALAMEGSDILVAAGDLPASSNNFRPGTGLVVLYTPAQLAASQPPRLFLPPWLTSCEAGDGGLVVGSDFGSAVALRNDAFVVGASGDWPESGGAAYLYARPSGGAWSDAATKLRAHDAFLGDRFGSSADVSSHVVVVGAPSKSTVTANDGAAYVFRLALPEGDPCTKDDECHSDSCVDGVCCADECGGGKKDDCVACSIAAGGTKDGACTPAQSSVVCRAATGECDVEDHCDGFARDCPADVTRPNGATCSSGVCLAGACAPAAPDAGAETPAASDDGSKDGCATAARGGGGWIGVLIAAALVTVARRRRTR